MGTELIQGLRLSPLNIIQVSGGNVFHALKSSDASFNGFGEAYFSSVEYGAIKAWKRHREMTLNLVVPSGSIQFVVFDDRQTSSNKGVYYNVILSMNNYCRLTIPPMVWFGFQGIETGTNLLLNVANIQHDPQESDRKQIDDIRFDWEIKQ